MIVQLAIAPNTIREILDAKQSRAQHLLSLSAIQIIREHGTLVLPSDIDMRELVQLTKSRSNASVAQLWLELFLYLFKRRRLLVPAESPQSLDSVFDAKGLDELLGFIPDCRLLVLPEDAIKKIFPDWNGSLISHNTIGLIDGAMIAHEGPLASARQMANSVVWGPGYSRSDFWLKVLGPLRNVADEITIVDRYLLKGVWKNFRQPANNYPDALAWILQQIDAAAGSSVSLKIISSVGSAGNLPPSAADAKQALLSACAQLPNRRITSLKLYSSDRLVDLPHNRHVRFGNQGVISVGDGFDRLDSQFMNHAYGMAWGYHSSSEVVNSYVSDERRAISQCVETLVI